MVTSPEGTDTRPSGRVFAPKATRRLRRSPYFRNPYVARRRGPSLREILIFVALLVVLLMADGAYVASRIQTPLSESGRFLTAGANALQEGDVSAAREAFTNATASAEEADNLSSRPSLFLASYIPALSREADAIRALSRSARLFASAGGEAADAIEVLGGTSREEIAAALYDRGTLQFDTIQEAQTALATVAVALTDAREILESAPFPRIDRLATALETARDRVIEVQPRAVAGARLLDAVPRMMGRDEPRNYFVALQNPGEARATGGLIGLYGVMEAAEGRIRLTTVGPAFELATEIENPLETGVLLPPWYAERYGDEPNFASVNRSSSFPVVSRAILQMYRNATGIELDGVWSFDPLAFREITAATGPLRGPGFDAALGPDNAAEVLFRDIYTHFGQDTPAQTAFLIGVIQDLYAKLGSRQADTPALFQALADAAQGSHFKIFSSSPDEQDVLEDLGLDGGLETEGPPRQLVYHNNLEGNKVDSYLERTIRSTIALTAEGGADITTTAVLNNEAPSGPPSIVLGLPQQGERVGHNQMELNFVLPQGAEDISATMDGAEVSVSRGEEQTFPLAALDVDIPAGQTVEVTVSYSLARVQRFRPGGRDFRFILAPQPSANADSYEVEVTAPNPYGLVRPGAASRAPASRLSFSGGLDVPVTIRASVVRR